MNIRIPKEVVSQPLGDEMVLLHLATGVYWSLNETGAAIWQELSQHGDVARTMSNLEKRYSTPALEVRQATQDLLTRLLREGLIEPA